MIGHLFTLLFVGTQEPTEGAGTPPSIGGPDGVRSDPYDDFHLYEQIRIEAERTRARSNMAAVHLILALAVSGEFD